MANTIRVALPGYDAETDTNPDHFALYGDEDWVLIKEKSHGYINIQPSSHVHIAHNLGYVPMVFVYGRESADTWTMILGDSADAASHIEVSTTELIIYNGSGVKAIPFTYYIFYDQII